MSSRVYARGIVSPSAGVDLGSDEDGRVVVLVRPETGHAFVVTVDGARVLVGELEAAITAADQS